MITIWVWVINILVVAEAPSLEIFQLHYQVSQLGLLIIGHLSAEVELVNKFELV